MQFVDKRKLERFNLEIPAHIKIIKSNQKDERVDALTRDICSGGAFLKTDLRLPVGTDISVDLILPLDKFKQIKEGSMVHISVTGKVLRANPVGMGVRFDESYEIRPWQEGSAPEVG